MNIAEVFDMDHLDKTGELRPLGVPDIPSGPVADLDDNAVMSDADRRYWAARLGNFGVQMNARMEEHSAPPPPPPPAEVEDVGALTMAEYTEQRARFGMTDRREGFIVP